MQVNAQARRRIQQVDQCGGRQSILSVDRNQCGAVVSFNNSPVFNSARAAQLSEATQTMRGRYSGFTAVMRLNLMSPILKP